MMTTIKWKPRSAYGKRKEALRDTFLVITLPVQGSTAAVVAGVNLNHDPVADSYRSSTISADDRFPDAVGGIPDNDY